MSLMKETFPLSQIHKHVAKEKKQESNDAGADGAHPVFRTAWIGSTAWVAQSYAMFWKGVESKVVEVVTPDTVVTQPPTTPTTERSTVVSPVVMESKPKPVPRQLDTIYQGCADTKLCYGVPENCIQTGNCKAIVAIFVAGDKYTFEIQGTGNPKYVAAALSMDNKMGDDSAMECVRSDNGRVNLFTSWTYPKVDPYVRRSDSPQDIVQLIESSFIEGKLYYADRVGFHSLAYESTGEPLALSSVGEAAGASKLLLKLHGSFMIAAWLGAASYFRQTWVGKQLGGKDIWFAEPTSDHTPALSSGLFSTGCIGWSGTLPTFLAGKPQNMDILRHFQNIAWCKPDWCYPSMSKETNELLHQCIGLPRLEYSDDVEEAIKRSEAFPIEEFGSAIEKALYRVMTVPELIDRILKKRAISFMNSQDHEGGWETVGTLQQKPPLTLDNCLSYDELKLSSMVYVSGHTECINDGNRYNAGQVAEEDIESDAVIIGLGVWKISAHQADVYVLTFLERVRSFLKMGVLNHVTDVNFAYIKPSASILGLFTNITDETEGVDSTEKRIFFESKRHPKGGINVQLENREPSAKLTGEHAGKLLVITYPWDGNAFPGNEF
ncbi:hypothetical protein MSG28_012811 [Choristoneura fumiferana]|nr:hypothetical protein MSG28_012811 [Choristoneura fumiferana]